ncbi:hypothetical protein [Vulgatibacter sp.]|uniref:hypothetical protein n=1 Tax=Vulgatibacter sp. TaxID=1971226 RepID=UPI003562628D
MSRLRKAECVVAEERLLGCTAADVARTCEEEAIAAHLAACATCRTLAADLSTLASLPPLPGVRAEVVARTLAAAGAELRRVAAEGRRTVRRAAMQIAAIAAVCLPLSAAWIAAVWKLGSSWLAPVLPTPIAAAFGVGFGLFCLAALSALAFTLTLLAGAAARPPRAAASEV